jgi:acyl dehydratase
LDSARHDATPSTGSSEVSAPYFEDLARGQSCAKAPSVTLNPGHAAQHQAIFGDRLTILAWRSCDHLDLVFEGDTLSSTVELQQLDPLPTGGALLQLRSRVAARGKPDERERAVLDRRLFGAMA